jgi:hypothetical protein
VAVSLQNISPERRLMITQKVMASLDDWGLSGEQILAVLDFPEGHRSRHLQKYRKDTPLPDDEAINARVVRLLGIIDALRTTYPRNVNMGPRWMNTPHRRMKDRTPVHTMLEDGENGVIAVLSELDCAYAWELSGSTMPTSKC